MLSLRSTMRHQQVSNGGPIAAIQADSPNISGILRSTAIDYPGARSPLITASLDEPSVPALDNHLSCNEEKSCGAA